MADMSKTRVMVVDDHMLVREGITALLSMHEHLEVVAQARDGQEAVALASKHMPDVILMDISMPGLGGLEATVAIRKDQPEAKVLVLSQYDDIEYVDRMLKAGASGYVLKSAGGAELVSAIQAVARGESYLHAPIATRVIEGYLGRRQEVTDSYDLLTDREKQVLKLIGEGQTHKEISRMLDISQKTVVAHQTNISEKLGLHSKAELMKFAFVKGIVKLA